MFPSKSPATGKDLAAVEATPAESVAGLVTKARAAQQKWLEFPADRRARVIAKVKKIILQRAEEIGRLIHEETGKPEVEALLGEVLASANGKFHGMMQPMTPRASR
jgi:acyl-CoA reductase-like NAD-dependent aldehyde dehydrogenase